MKYALLFLYLAVSCHLVDASYNYFRENEMRSAILNGVMSLLSIAGWLYFLFD